MAECMFCVKENIAPHTAYKAFEEGELLKALDILDEDEMELDYRARKQKILEKQNAELRKNALSYLTYLETP